MASINFTSAADDFMGKFGNEMIKETINQEAVLLGKLPKVVAGGDQGLDVFNVDQAFGHVANQADGGALIDGASVTPVQGIARASIKRSAILIGRAAAEFLTGGRQAVDLFERQTKQAARSLARAYGRGIIKENLHVLTDADVDTGGAFDTVSSTSGTLAEIAGIRPGDFVAVYASDGTTLREIVKFTQAQIDPDGQAHTVTIVRDQEATLGVATGTSDAPVAGDILKLYTPASAQALVSLADLAGTGNLYGITTLPHFVGQSVPEGGALDEVTLRQLHMAVLFQSGAPATMIASNARNRSRYQSLVAPQLQFMKGDVLDAYGGKLEAEFDGSPWVIDHLIDDTEVYMVPTAKEDIYMRWFREPKVDTVGAEGSGRMAGFDKSSTVFAYQGDAWGAGALVCPGRHKVGRITGITG